ncbi:hypothetical protein N9195_01800 [bacterium]|nr:hypothetical protein [bacterium]
MIAPGESVNLVLEYHSPSSREVPTPTFSVTPQLPFNPPNVVPAGKEPDKLMVMQDRTILLEFETTPGKRYQIQYSPDMQIWHASPAVIEANANRTQWFDQGLPKTNCHPKDCNMRLYRVVEIANTNGN